MNLTADTYSVTSTLMAAFALFVIYSGSRTGCRATYRCSFILSPIAYMRSIEGDVPFWLLCRRMRSERSSLRFEFMNELFTGFIKCIEIGVLGRDHLSCGQWLWRSSYFSTGSPAA